MSNPYLVLWCDPSQNKIYSGWQQTTEASTPFLKQGDRVGVELHWVNSSQFGGGMNEVEFPPLANVTLAIGLVDEVPLSGSFTISYEGDTTSPMSPSILATELQTRLNLLDSITDAGGVTVSKLGKFYKIVFNNNGAITGEFTANIDGLSPTSEANFVETKAGTATTQRIVLFKLRQSIIAGTSEFENISQPSVTVTNIFSKTYRVSINPYPKDGSFFINFTRGVADPQKTSPLRISSSSTDIANELNFLNRKTPAAVLAEEEFTVVSSGLYSWDITVPDSVVALTVDSAVVGFSALYGSVSMNTTEVEEFLSGVEQRDAILEVQVDVDGEIQTIAQVPVIVSNDLIQNSSFELVDLGSVIPENSCVRYDTSQSLTTLEKQTARTNISAASEQSVADMQLTVSEIEQQTEFLIDNPINPFNQSLNTTNSPTFSSLTLTNTVSSPLVFSPSGAGNKIRIETDGSLIGNFITVVGEVSTTESSFDLNAEDGLVITDGDNASELTTLGLTLTGDSVITFADGSVMDSAVLNTSTFLLKANNLSDLPNKQTARTNLQLGTIATEAATDYLSKADNLSGLASNSTARTNLGLGSIAVEESSLFARKSENLSGLASVSTARSNLGLGSIATTSADDWLSKSGNLFGIQDTAAARTNIGLGISSNPQFNSINFGGKVQSVAGPTAPTNFPNVKAIPVWSVDGQRWINSTETTSGTLLDWRQGSTYPSQFIEWLPWSAENESTYDYPCLRVGIEGVSTTYGPSGIRFPDGTKQTSAAGNLSSNEIDVMSAKWNLQIDPDNHSVNDNITSIQVFNFKSLCVKPDSSQSLPAGTDFAIYDAALRMPLTGFGGIGFANIGNYIAGDKNSTQYNDPSLTFFGNHPIDWARTQTLSFSFNYSVSANSPIPISGANDALANSAIIGVNIKDVLYDSTEDAYELVTDYQSVFTNFPSYGLFISCDKNVVMLWSGQDKADVLPILAQQLQGYSRIDVVMTFKSGIAGRITLNCFGGANGSELVNTISHTASEIFEPLVFNENADVWCLNVRCKAPQWYDSGAEAMNAESTQISVSNVKLRFNDIDV